MDRKLKIPCPQQKSSIDTAVCLAASIPKVSSTVRKVMLKKLDLPI